MTPSLASLVERHARKPTARPADRVEPVSAVSISATPRKPASAAASRPALGDAAISDADQAQNPAEQPVTSRDATADHAASPNPRAESSASSGSDLQTGTEREAASLIGAGLEIGTEKALAANLDEGLKGASFKPADAEPRNAFLTQSATGACSSTEAA